MSLPDKPRASLAPPARALAASALDLTRRLTWRTLHPADRERFLEAPAPKPVSRLPYRTVDGWSAPLFHVPAAPNGAGEPVILAHSLGFGPDAFRYGTGTPLAQALAARGFDVYLLAHRGDREANGPKGTPMDFDAIVERDVPAAVKAVREHTGFDRVHWVGHGLGGQLGMVAAARREALASVVALGSPVRFRKPATEVQQAALLMRLLPDGWVIPSATLARLALPAIGTEEWFGAAPGGRVRGALEFAGESVALGLVDQLRDWISEGTLTSRKGVVDYTSTFRDANVPLLVVFATESRLAGRTPTTAALSTWGHRDSLALPVPGRSMDLVLGANRERDVFGPVSAWMMERRRLAWSEGYQRLCG
ncbi:MAG: alpha/beta fold hydrolase [Alphaproteobacteria bacterium]|nr:alpha/beta fold hydrolase [Alphaproteobacteria bacterium]